MIIFKSNNVLKMFTRFWNKAVILICVSGNSLDCVSSVDEALYFSPLLLNTDVHTASYHQLLFAI